MAVRSFAPEQVHEQSDASSGTDSPAPLSLRDALGVALGLGVVCGLRVVRGSTVLSRAAAHGVWPAPRTGLVRLTSGRRAAQLATLAVAGEFVADKLPFIPSRVKPGPLIGRAVSGASVGSSSFRVAGRSGYWGALVGGFGAVLGSYAGYLARSTAVSRTGLPDPVIAVVEDVVAMRSGSAIVRKPALGFFVSGVALIATASLWSRRNGGQDAQ